MQILPGYNLDRQDYHILLAKLIATSHDPKQPPKQPFFNGCFNWMMNQIFTWEMVVLPNIHFNLVVWGSR